MLERGPTNRDPSPEILSDQQRLLYGELQKRDPPLAQMYFGAIWVLRDRENPERIPQAACSMREMMNGLPNYEIEEDSSPDVYDRVNRIQRLWDTAMGESDCFRNSAWEGEIDEPLTAFLSEMIGFFDWYSSRPTPAKAASEFIRRQRHSESFYPEFLHKKRLESWQKAYRFFNGVLHHGKVVEYEEFVKELQDTEQFLMELFLPRPTRDFDSLDELIREGESDAHY